MIRIYLHTAFHTTISIKIKKYRMKKNVFILSVILFLLSGNFLYSQNAVFTNQSHDFGTIVETDGAVSYKFMLTNTGDEPLMISNVKGCCGTVINGWTKEPIEHDGQGFVEVTVNPKGRIGNFNKTITVYTNGNPQSISLTIKGNVVRQAVEPKKKDQ